MSITKSSQLEVEALPVGYAYHTSPDAGLEEETL